MVNFRQSYDLTPAQIDLQRRRDVRKLALRNEYQRLIGDPARPPGHVPDPMIVRHQVFMSRAHEYFKPTMRNGLGFLFGYAVPAGLLMYWTKRFKAAKEAKFRSGEVSYFDRNPKFLN